MILNETRLASYSGLKHDVLVLVVAENLVLSFLYLTLLCPCGDTTYWISLVEIRLRTHSIQLEYVLNCSALLLITSKRRSIQTRLRLSR